MKLHVNGLKAFSMIDEKDVTIFDNNHKPLFDDSWILLTQGFARDGLTNKDICKKLGCSEYTFYKELKARPKLSHALKEGRRPVNIELENKLIDLGMGNIETTEVTDEAVIDKTTGQEVQLLRRSVKRKQNMPQLSAIKYYLENRDKTKAWNEGGDKKHGSQGFIDNDLEIIVEDKAR